VPQQLTVERWQRLEALFLEGLELPADTREAFIARVTAGDEDLRRQLTGMLTHAADGGDRIARAIEGVAHGVGPGSSWIGRHVGPYRIVREIGRGGMGLVFEAVRDDDQYRKTVALKVAPWWRDVALQRERFRLERQILAELEHPNIARFLDGGTSDGVPYFVMELVEGQPITQYCAEHQIDLPQRIALFRQVCGAVHFAHESLIVHRDLKPANIFVDDQGSPKLLDFGIAKLLDPLADASMTIAGADALWTPDYTSPEQVRGRPVTIRTDVYSLGLVLYELLGGERAQTGDLSSPSALEQSVCVAEPAPPSARAEARGDRVLARRLRGDLDTIVMTAIRKEPERRYASVAALSDDLGNYLEGRPIVARKSTFLYRANKLLRRHSAAAVATALVAASLVAGGVATLYQARRAERRFQQVRTLANTFVFDVHDRIATLPGSTEARKAIVSTALTYLENLRADAGDDPALARELAAAYERVGNVQGNPLDANLGDTAGALASFARAEEIVAPLANRGDPEALLRLASVLDYSAIVFRGKGDAREALGRFARARDIGEQLLAASPDDRNVLDRLGDVMANLSRAHFELHEYAAAEQSARRTMELAQRLVSLSPNDRNYRIGLSTADNTLGTTLIDAGRLDEAADYYRKSIAIREQLVEEEPNNIEFRRNLLVAYGNLGDVLGYRLGQNLGDTAGAAAAFGKAAEIAEWARRHDPADRRATFDLVNAKLRLGGLFGEADPPQPEAAIRDLGEARRLNLSLLETEPKSNRFGYAELVIDRRLGEAMLAAGRTAEAVQLLEGVRARAPEFLQGPTAPNSRLQLVLSTTRLASIRAAAGDKRAAALADAGASQMANGQVDTAAIEAVIYADLARANMTIARREAPAERVARLRGAVVQFETSAARWRAAKIAPALESRRTKALSAIDADIAVCRRDLGASGDVARRDD
jgi:serine/threonine protein kinase